MLPAHDEISWSRRILESVCIAAAVTLLAVHAVRLARAIDVIAWWMPAALVLGMIAADFASGLVHWTADTWGSETMPLFGSRVLRPFRVHHVNPDDFLRRSFIDTNGDVALLVTVFLVPALLIPLDRDGGQAAALFAAGFCAVGLPTNQVHQWAHRPRPPRWVAWLQARHVILNRTAHLEHHRAPYAMRYCIATGWCNRALDRLGFFRRLERVVSRLTGLAPRRDDGDFQAKVAARIDRRPAKAAHDA